MYLILLGVVTACVYLHMYLILLGVVAACVYLHMYLILLGVVTACVYLHMYLILLGVVIACVYLHMYLILLGVVTACENAMSEAVTAAKQAEMRLHGAQSELKEKSKSSKTSEQSYLKDKASCDAARKEVERIEVGVACNEGVALGEHGTRVTCIDL